MVVVVIVVVVSVVFVVVFPASAPAAAVVVVVTAVDAVVETVAPGAACRFLRPTGGDAVARALSCTSLTPRTEVPA